MKMMHFTGINGNTGESLLPPMSQEDLVSWIQDDDDETPEATKGLLRTLWEKLSRRVLGVREGVDPLDLEQARWGVIYHLSTPQEVRDELAELVDYRKGQEYTYKPGESAHNFRKRHGQGFGDVDPNKLPYYLMIVGPPTQIPFRFQYDLDSQHAVGRICFEKAEDYGSYARSVMEYDSTKCQLPRDRLVAFFSPNRDPAVKQTADLLVKPLAEKLKGMEIETPTGDTFDYQSEHNCGETAKKPDLLKLITRTEHQPSLLFTATHGLTFPGDADKQMKEQGALSCQEWPGSNAWPGGTVPDSMYLHGGDITGDMRLDGLMVFAYACYSAGTPQKEDYAHYFKRKPMELAPQPFVAYLPQRMLAQGALAFIGHVELTWSYSYGWPGVGPLIGTFEWTLEAILKGKPVGHAFETFNRRYLDLNNHLTQVGGMLDKYYDDEPVEDDLIQFWTARNDARAFIVFGDPAVRLKPYSHTN